MFGVEARQRLGLLLVGEERVEVLQLVVAAPAVHLPVVREGEAVRGAHRDVHHLLPCSATRRVPK